jgi:predicted RNA-binding Zn ribbon-like protein
LYREYVRSQVILNTYDLFRAQLVEDFINTYDLYLEEPEHLRTPADLVGFLKAHGMEIEASGTPSEQMLESVRLLRANLRDCWTADTLEELAQGLNPLLGNSSVELQAKPEDERLSLQLKLPSNASLPQYLAVECAWGIAAIEQNFGMDRMRSCAAEPCRDVFVDTSRNKTRRFCSDRCANRYNIAAFRGRQKHAHDENT